MMEGKIDTGMNTVQRTTMKEETGPPTVMYKFFDNNVQ